VYDGVVIGTDVVVTGEVAMGYVVVIAGMVVGWLIVTVRYVKMRMIAYIAMPIKIIAKMTETQNKNVDSSWDGGLRLIRLAKYIVATIKNIISKIDITNTIIAKISTS